MPATIELDFEQPDMVARLEALSDEALDRLDFGVIGFDDEDMVRRYNAAESRMAGLAPQRVLGFGVFTTVAPCMNNFLVAQRFDDAKAEAAPLDAYLDYVFTLRMRPTKVRLRLLASPGVALRYVLVNRRS